MDEGNSEQLSNVINYYIEFDLKASLDGKYFSIRYLKSGFFAIYAITNKNIRFPKESDNIFLPESLHPLGSVEIISTGCATSLEWHQEKNEYNDTIIWNVYWNRFIVLAPIDKSGKFIELKEKVETVSKGFFGGKVSKKTFQVNSEEIIKFIVAVYRVTEEDSGPKVNLLMKNDK